MKTDRRLREHRTVLWLLATVALLASALALAPGSGAAVNTCRVRNITQDTRVDTSLQTAINAASPGDVITVRDVCVGRFRVATNLILLGRPSQDLTRPVVHANGVGRAMQVSADVTLVNLVITGGLGAVHGGGIHNTGTLTLETVLVRGNSASDGGGIYNTGSLTLNDSQVRGNTGRIVAGGIYNTGSLTLNDASSVRGNSVRETHGGGIENESGGIITLNDSSSVSGNTAGVGGGIKNTGGIITLNDSSYVSGNTAIDGGGICCYGILTLNDASYVIGNGATHSGGGIYNYDKGGSSVTLNDSSSVSGNTADADDDGSGEGGGILNFGCLVGVNPSGNVYDNFLGNGIEDNVVDLGGCS